MEAIPMLEGVILARDLHILLQRLALLDLSGVDGSVQCPLRRNGS
jgi:hypothetical protein